VVTYPGNIEINRENNEKLGKWDKNDVLVFQTGVTIVPEVLSDVEPR
jgi:hypothetical protein